MHWCTLFLALAAPSLSLPLFPRETSYHTKRALWLWESDIIKSSDALDKFFSLVAKYGFTQVHALIDRDMGNAAWEPFVAECNSRGIAIDALMGDPQWILGQTTADGPTLQHQLDWIAQYQQSASPDAQFSGIHMDVEPWVVDGWEANKEKYVNSLLDIADKVVSFAKPLHLPVAADLPFWANTVTCKNAKLDTCLLGNLDSVTFMTYRNTAPALLEIAAPLLESVASAHSGTIWLSVETNPQVADAGLISYAGKGVGALMNDLATVEKYAAKKDSGFAGIAVHDYTSFAALGS